MVQDVNQTNGSCQIKNPLLSSGSLLTDLTVATRKFSNNMSMRVLGPNLEDFGPKLEENKPFEFLKKNVSFVFHRPSTVLLFY